MADTRLERQRRPARMHVRKNARYYVRGYTTVPHPVWGDLGGTANPPPVIVATGVTAGTPGSFTPAGATPVANYTALTARGAMGQTAAWTAGQFVILGDGTEAWWTGTAWAAGKAPEVLEDAHVTDPGSFTITDLQEWLDDHPVLAAAQRLRDNEAARMHPRATLLDWLDGFIESLDGPD